jgi:ketosteroid isomerase-like protein
MKLKTILLLALTLGIIQSYAQNGENEVIEIDKKLNKLIMENNSAEAAGYYTEDFLLVTSGGGAKSKKDVVAEISSPELKIQTNETLKVKVRVHENTAVLTGVLIQKGSYKGKEFDVKLLVTDTWIKTESGWKLLSGHASKAPESIL